MNGHAWDHFTNTSISILGMQPVRFLRMLLLYYANYLSSEISKKRHYACGTRITSAKLEIKKQDFSWVFEKGDRPFRHSKLSPSLSRSNYSSARTISDNRRNDAVLNMLMSTLPLRCSSHGISILFENEGDENSHGVGAARV